MPLLLRCSLGSSVPCDAPRQRTEVRAQAAVTRSRHAGQTAAPSRRERVLQQARDVEALLSALELSISEDLAPQAGQQASPPARACSPARASSSVAGAGSLSDADQASSVPGGPFCAAQRRRVVAPSRPLTRAASAPCAAAAAAAAETSAAGPASTAWPPAPQQVAQQQRAQIMVCTGKACSRHGSGSVLAAMQSAAVGDTSVGVQGCKVRAPAAATPGPAASPAALGAGARPFAAAALMRLD